MSKLSKGFSVCVMMGACVLLYGCGVGLDDTTPTVLDNQADYSVSISLPYATVAPDRAPEEVSEPLEIDTEGNVKVNDSASVLREGDTEVTGSSNYKSLRQGNTGFAVQVLQTRLKELGYYTAEVTGVFDSETEAAVRRFEQTFGTMQTGVATSDLQERLYAPDAIVYGSDAYNSAVVSQYRILQPGDSGSAVYALQQRLRSLGYPITKLTGVFDDETANAVGLFYQQYGLSYSEIANVALQQELYSDTARTYENAPVESAVDMDVAENSNFAAVTLNNIKEIQSRLIELGYMSGEPTGEVDDATLVAIRLLCNAYGEPVEDGVTQKVVDLLNREDAPTFTQAYGSYANLLEGSEGDPVRTIQNRLVALGFVTGTPNGKYGETTTAAIRLFQSRNGLPETGIATARDQAVLFSPFVQNIDGVEVYYDQPTNSEWEGSNAAQTVAESPIVPVENTASRLTVGSSGDDVLALQYRLTELGYVSSITANFDSITERAVISFQENIGVEANGIAGVTLIGFINSDAAPNSSVRYHSETQNYRVLTLNDTGDDVAALQKVLWQLGYLDQNAVTVGVYDDPTAQAVLNVQTALNYKTPDGIAGPELQCYLNSDYASTIKK